MVDEFDNTAFPLQHQVPKPTEAFGGVIVAISIDVFVITKSVAAQELRIYCIGVFVTVTDWWIQLFFNQMVYHFDYYSNKVFCVATNIAQRNIKPNNGKC